MSFSDVRPYFRSAITKVSKLKEWKTGLNTDNIPSTILEGAFHIDVGAFNQIKQNQDCLDLQGSVRIKLFAKGAKDPIGAVDRIVAVGDAVLDECLKASVRLLQPSIKNVELVSFTPGAYSGSDDNDIVLEMIFRVTLVKTIPRGV